LAKKYSNYYLDEAGYAFSLAILEICRGNQNKAIEHFRYAEKIDPELYHISYLINEKNSFFYGTKSWLYQLIFNEVNSNASNITFEEKYIEVLKMAMNTAPNNG
jgi:tetratricopeptide (TPR) repeat protein